MTISHQSDSTRQRTATVIVVPLVLCFACLLLVGGCRKAAQESQSSVSTTDYPVESTKQDAGSASRGGIPAFQPAIVDPDAPVVTVNGASLNGALFNQMVAQQQGNPAFAQIPLEQRQQTISKNVVEQFIVTKLIEQEMQKTPDFAVTESDYTVAMEELGENLPKGVSLESWAASQGITVKDLRKSIEPQIRMKLFLENRVGNIEASDEDIAKHFEDNKSTYERADETVKARHILLTCPKNAEETEKQEKRTLAEKYRKELLEGADFVEIAGLHSDCPSAKEGGDLGVFDRNTMVPEFTEAAFSQEINEIGDVLETDFGFHIIQVMAHTDAGMPALDEIREKVAKDLETQRFRDGAAQYVDGLKSNAEIVHN